MIRKLQKEARALSKKDRALALKRYFKTGKGEYGEGDRFLGLTLAEVRGLAKKYSNLNLDEVSMLLGSKYHEERVIAIVILTRMFEKGDGQTKDKVYKFYLKNTQGINNWDLVDISAGKIIGEYLCEKGEWEILKKLAVSKNLWERRMALIATSAFIKSGDAKPTFAIAEMLLNDKQDLIHKAAGWMLREAGKKCSESAECEFLDKHIHSMPRTMLRYAIEKFANKKRLEYLAR